MLVGSSDESGGYKEGWSDALILTFSQVSSTRERSCSLKPLTFPFVDAMTKGIFCCQWPRGIEIKGTLRKNVD